MRALALAVCLITCSTACSTDEPQPQPDTGVAVDIDDFVRSLPTSCAFNCKDGCPEERVGPFKCPALGPWEQMPHEPTCGSPTMPANTKGKCEIGPATGAAVARAGRVDAGTFVLPDGHRLTPVGVEKVLVDDTHVGGFPVSIAVASPTRFGVVVEAGFGDHVVRSIDLDTLAIVSTVRVEQANWGPAIIALPSAHRVLVSGGATGKIWSLTLDDTTGALKLDDKPIDLAGFFAAGLAVSPDGKRLIATGARATDAKIVSLETADFGAVVSAANVGGNEQFGAFVDPLDTAGESAWVTMWEDAKVVGVDLRTGAVKRSINTGKNPESVAFLDARFMVVSAADGDTLSLIDRVAGSIVATIPIEKGTHGWSPTAMAYDAANKRLYVAEAIINAVEVFDVTLGTTPTLASRGRIPTAWWPTDLALYNGKLIVLEGRGYGTGIGRTGKPFGPGQGEIAESMRGTIRAIDVASLDLTKTSAAVAQNLALAGTAGYPQPSCTDDFPVPTTNTAGPSQQIKHFVFVVRENKTFDALLGDLPGVEGDPKNSLVPGDAVIPNLRAIGKRWAIGDNYYTDAEFSSQGHVWTTYGRTTDYTERIWHIAASSKGRELGGGVTDVGRAEEGSVFEWMLRLNVEQDILGEATGLPPPPKDKRNPLDRTYPGLAQMVGLEDTTKACYFAARARARCDFHDFVYVTLPNDHTFGGGGNRPSPETMMAVNDEATGMLVEALSTSPMWASTLVIITEDDPQDGGDHIDLHRTPVVFAGPFVKRGYVAKGHYDVASVIKLFAHIRGLPYPNEVVARAALPLEVFTSSPDFAAYKTLPRVTPLQCNATSSSFATEAAMWDWDELDEQPGLGRHLRRWFKATPEERLH
jgi:DNA-binding beta-propeller fold protein YncE